MIPNRNWNSEQFDCKVFLQLHMFSINKTFEIDALIFRCVLWVRSWLFQALCRHHSVVAELMNQTEQIVTEFVYCLLISGGKMTTPTLYYLPPSPPCRSILLLAKMLGLDFELKIVNILEGEQLKPDFVAMNPQHCLPTMNDQGLVLWERWVTVPSHIFDYLILGDTFL